MSVRSEAEGAEGEVGDSEVAELFADAAIAVHKASSTENKAKEYRLEQAQIDILELIRQDYYNGENRRDMGEVRS